MGRELPTLRGFSYETAAEHLHTRVPVASRSSPVDEIRRSLGEKGYDSLTHIAILEGTTLVGVLTIENLFSTPEGSVAEQVMDPQPPVVAPGTDQEVAAWRAVEHGERQRKGETMKRIPELRTLSEDHHHGLVQTRRLRRAAEADETASAESTARNFLDFWQKDTALHFRKEEEVLLPVIARYGGDISREPLAEMIEDHTRIRGLVMQLSDETICGNVRLETLHELGERLEAHIRLEERVVFPLIEESLSEAALTELAARLEVKDAGPRVEPWVPAQELSYAPWPGPGDSEGGGYD